MCMYICKMKYYSALRKRGILPYVTAWMDLEGIMLCEISQTKKDKHCMILFIHGICFLKSQTLRNSRKVAVRHW